VEARSQLSGSGWVAAPRPGRIATGVVVVGKPVGRASRRNEVSWAKNPPNLAALLQVIAGPWNGLPRRVACSGCRPCSALQDLGQQSLKGIPAQVSCRGRRALSGSLKPLRACGDSLRSDWLAASRTIWLLRAVEHWRTGAKGRPCCLRDAGIGKSR